MKAGPSPPASTSRAAGARTLVVHVLAVVATVLVLLWCIGFRGGLAFRSSNKQQIFNVHPPLMLIGLVVIAGEAILFAPSRPLSAGTPGRRRTWRCTPRGSPSASSASTRSSSSTPRRTSPTSTRCTPGSASPQSRSTRSSGSPASSPSSSRRRAGDQAVRGAVARRAGAPRLRARRGQRAARLPRKAHLPAVPAARLVGKYGAEALLVNFTAVIVLLLGIAVVIATVNADATRYTAM
ncbi:hypothetical protein ZWY2020_003160 [Hordeum vulgare]|nr:hypothetical protein ZWY2020_003160 [Hordeum vulgare]